MLKVIENIEKYILYIVVALFPIFVLTSNTAPVSLSKAEFLGVAASLFIVSWVIKTIVKGSITFASGKFDLGVILLIATYVLSTLLATPNKMEAFLIPGITTFVIISGAFYFLINQEGKGARDGVLTSFVVSGLIFALSVILTEIDFFAKIPQLPAFIKDASFNTFGGTIPGIMYLIPIVFLALGIIFKEKDVAKKIFWGVTTAVMIMAVVAMVANSLPGKAQAPNFPDFKSTWEVTVTTLAKNPIFGMGPANYLTAFNLFRPVSYNATPLWQVRFTSASDFYLTLITETGLLGLLALLVLFVGIYKYFAAGVKLNTSLMDKLALASLIILFAIFPIAPALLFPFFALLSLNSGSHEKTVTLNTSPSPKVPGIILGLILLSGVGVLDFIGARVVLAENTFKGSLDALARNDAKGTYDLMKAAINQNPKVDRYHASFAQVNMVLAASLGNKKDITDSDRSTITELVQQAISEAKATVALNSGRSNNWEILAQIYKSIMPFAQGADQFTIQSYTQAIALDPTNPNLRIALGGVYYALGRYDEAIDAFKLAVLAKPDLANAHYNLAIAYREKKDYDSAITEMNTVLGLVKKDSQDYTLAKNVLEDIQKKKVAVAGNSENLTAPQKNQTSNIKPPITLPSEATPPASP